MEIPLLIVLVLVIIAWKISDHMAKKQAHQERMELLKLIKAQNLTEYTTSDQPQSTKPSNFIRSAMKEAYNKGDYE